MKGVSKYSGIQYLAITIRSSKQESHTLKIRFVRLSARNHNNLNGSSEPDVST